MMSVGTRYVVYAARKNESLLRRAMEALPLSAWIVGCTVPFSRFLCEETAISCCFHSKKHFCANHFQAVVNVPISLTFVQNLNLSGQKHTPARLVSVRVVRHFNKI